MQPDPQDYTYELDAALAAVVGIRTTIPRDAFTAEILGTERAGHGVLIRADGLVLTIGYLVTEAEQVWITLEGGRSVPGHVLGYDQETGFGLVQLLARVELPALPLGTSQGTALKERVVVAGFGGRRNAVAARIIARQEFAGYWEYVLDEALFTAPSHPHWGGTALIGPTGELIGIGSLQLQQARQDGSREDLNMMVPIDLLKPIMNDMLTLGRPNRPARPWLGLYATEMRGRIVVAGVAGRGPARSAQIKTGDLILGVGEQEVKDLAGFFRRVWSLGPAGTEIPLTVFRDGRTLSVKVKSVDRRRYLKGPVLH
jgi:S1-C subfamily serine protease